MFGSITQEVLTWTEGKTNSKAAFYLVFPTVNVNLKMGDYGVRKVGRSGGEKLPPSWT